MASLSLYPQFETNLMSNRNVIELLLQLKSAKTHGKNCIKVKAHLVRHLLRNRLQSDEKQHAEAENVFHLVVALLAAQESNQILILINFLPGVPKNVPNFDG